MSGVFPPRGTATVIGSISGPTSYAAEGFEVDLSSIFETVDFFHLEIETAGATLPPCRVVITRNAPSPGMVKVRVERLRYDRPSTPSQGVGGQPAGVAVANASGDSAATVDAIGGAGDAHRVNQLYQHTHGVSVAQTDAAAVELAAGVNLATTTFRYRAEGR